VTGLMGRSWVAIQLRQGRPRAGQTAFFYFARR
jgi:hypothetical protein